MWMNLAKVTKRELDLESLHQTNLYRRSNGFCHLLSNESIPIYTGYQLLIQPKLVDSCSHMTLMHEKTLLIQPNFSSKKWRRVEKHIWSVVNASKNAFDPLSLLENNFDWLLEENTFDWLPPLKKRFWSAGSKAFSHASASHDYIGLLDQTLDPRVYNVICTYKMNFRNLLFHRIFQGSIPILISYIYISTERLFIQIEHDFHAYSANTQSWNFHSIYFTLDNTSIVCHKLPR